MKHFKIRVLIVSLCWGLCSVFLFSGVALGQSCEQWGGKIVSVQGVVQVQKAGESKWMPVGLNATYCPGDMIRVLKNSRAAIVLSNETLFRLDQNTTVTFTGVEKEKTFLIEILKGVTHFFSRQPRKLKVVTPFLNAAVEGTEFYVRVERDQTFMSIFEGRVVASNIAGGLALTGGQSAVAAAGKAPVLQVVVRPRAAVQWALYYPPVVDWRPNDFPGGQDTDWQGMVRKSIEYYWKGDMVGAFSVLEKPPEEIRDPRFYLYRAALFLTAGRVGAAQKDITKALTLDPSNSYAVALQSIIAVVQNDKDQALELANRAVDLDPKSSTAMVALSYAQQAHFDIQGALKSLQEAVKLGPENALAWSRLAELYLSVGELTKAARAANKAVALNQGLARTQTVLGFTLIDRVKIKAAKDTFNKAIELDSAAPLPRLGLGLAKIRGGDLKDGRAEIEIAASLDPNNSLIRSYLGKAYYEEKRDKLAEDQYAVAKKLDPLDPTAWFYDALRKQTINRPVEALQDMQKSIELNDNRAVYRSRLLLDEDLAARSASLGRIYNDLGFQQLGLVEGWKSVNTAPANYSAHRLLADLYSALPRHEVARVSELLQSQLLQPINNNPIQPQLAVSNLSILENAGPSTLSFNEFNPLFTRNDVRAQVNGVVGNNKTWGDDLVFSGIQGGVSFSLGQFHFETDGFRPNNDLEENIHNLFGQFAMTPKINFQVELSHRDKEHGDIDLNFDSGDFSTDDRRELHQKTARIGTHIAISPRSDLLASLIYSNREGEDLLSTSGPIVDQDIQDKGYQLEIQHQYKLNRFNVVAGIGTYDIDVDEESLFDWTPVFGFKCPPSPPFPNVECERRDSFTRKHDTAYLYTNVIFPQSVDWTLGFSYDSFEQRELDLDEFNPKFGIQWSITDQVRLRAAYSKNVKRTLVTDQTIEPTQVAGFNQFFDDVNGTVAKLYGAGVDTTILNNLYGGIELSHRDLDVPEFEGDLVSFADRDEDFYRAYLYWTPINQLAVSAEYQYQKIKRDGPGITKLKTTKLPLVLRYFGPGGFFGELGSVYVDQDVSRVSPLDDDDDDFVVFDLKVGYRLPKRWGLVSLEVQNLFDEDFRFQDLNFISSEPVSPMLIPERTVLVRVALSF